MNNNNLEIVNWSAIPAPVDDGSANHLMGMSMPDISLPSTNGDQVNLSRLTGWSVLYFYPMTGRPDAPLPTGWDNIPGARGCTPQSCAFRGLSQALADRGVSVVYGISTQQTGYQQEAVCRLGLPFSLLSDTGLKLATSLRLPTMKVDNRLLFKRLTMILYNMQIERVFFPVFPPDKNASDVLKFMESRCS